MPKTKKHVTFALLGLGTVGVAVAELLEKNRQLIESRIGAPLELKAALVRDLKKDRGGVPASVRVTTDPASIMDDIDIDIVVEVMGGFEPAYALMRRAIEAGKHIVTANKAVLAKHWNEIFELAHAKSVDVYMEASVGGGIPCVQAINDGLAANGIEACHNLAILGSISFDQRVRIEDVHLQGIRGITKQDIDIDRQEMGCVVKHLAMARTRPGDGALEVQVVPCLLPIDHLLARVDGVNNGILVKGDAVGEVLFSGRGAGGLPTASAVISDIIYVARNVAVGVAGRVPSIPYDVEKVQNRHIVPAGEIKNRFFVRLTAVDQPGALAAIARVFADHGISISSVAQNEKEKGSTVPVYVSTYQASEKAMRDAVESLEKLSSVKPGTLVMRLEVPE